MLKVLKVDANGFFVEDVILQDSEAIPTDCIKTPCSQGFYRPKWNGAEWIEGLTQAEIDAIKNVSQLPSIDERVSALEDVMLMII